jgi:hypothetical protein
MTNLQALVETSADADRLRFFSPVRATGAMNAFGACSWSMIQKSCRLFGQDHATEQMLERKSRFNLKRFRSRL